jgi:hypothetical protein
LYESIVRRINTGQQLEQCTFTTTVTANYTEKLAFFYFKGDALESLLLLKRPITFIEVND